MSDLTEFQKNILYVLANSSRYGLAIKKELENYYGDEVNHGRLYPNLDQLVEEGYVNKNSLDDRTNKYELSEEGERLILNELEWRIEMFVDHDPERSEKTKDIIETISDRRLDD